VIEAVGSTSLVESGNNFYLESISTGSGPELKYGGAPVVAGEFGGWTPIGAEQTSTGYEVAFKVPGANEYTIWTTDSSGNYTSDDSTLPGTSPAIESAETFFHQDLNGDGVIGVPTSSAAVTLTTSAPIGVAGNDTFTFHPALGAGIAANGESKATLELSEASLHAGSNQLAALSNDPYAGHWASLPQSADAGHETIINSGHHDGSVQSNTHIADALMHGFIIH
jgi:serralysin